MHLLIASEASYIILIAVYTVCSHEICFVSCKKSRTIIQLEFLGIIHCSMATMTGLCLRLKLMQNLRDLVRLRPAQRLDTCMWTQPRPRLSRNQDGDNVDGILGQPASFCLCPFPTTPVTCIQLLLPRPSSTWLLVSCCR
ncbi:hypothetical protein VPH35_006948 [Triticum aestivum]